MRISRALLPWARRAIGDIAHRGSASSPSGASDRLARDYRTHADPPVTLNFYRSQDGAPAETARHTAEGARAMERSVSESYAAGLGVRLNPGGPDLPEHLRENELSPVGVRNFENVRRALESHFLATSEAVLDGVRPIGIGGDHSMAVSTLRGATLGVLVREILRASWAFGGDRRLRLSGPHRQDLLGRFVGAARARDVLRLGALIDAAVDKGALSEPALYEFKHALDVRWYDAHLDANTPARLSGGARVVLEAGRPIVFESPSPSGNFHGMPVAVAMGFGPSEVTEFASRHLSLPPSSFAFVAVRDGDPAEHEALEKLSVPIYDMEAVERLGVRGVRDALERRAEARRKAFGFERLFKVQQVDIDFVDARHVPATGTPVGRGSRRNPAEGPSLAEGVELLRGLAREEGVVAIDLAENAYLPTPEGRTTLAAGQALLASMLDLDPHQRQRFFRPLPGGLG